MKLTDLIFKLVVVSMILSLTVGMLAFATDTIISNSSDRTVQSYKDQLTNTRRTCLESSKVINGTLEDQCAQLQDETDTEFICDVMGRCWLEWHGYPEKQPERLT